MHANAEEDDPVVLRVPVYVRPSTQQRPVCLFQYPLRPRWRPYNIQELQSARVRPQQRHFELNLGSECSPGHHDRNSSSPLTSISLASTITSPKTTYAIGMLHTDVQGVPEALCLTPLDTAVQMRPSFAEIDQQAAEAAEAASAVGVGGSGSSVAAGSGRLPASPTPRAHGGGRRVAFDDDAADDDNDALGSEPGGEGDGAGGFGGGEGYEEEEEEDAAGSTIAPQFRPAQTEREIEARRSSHAYLMEQRESEPWSDATLHRAESEASHAVRQRVFARP